MSRKKEERKIKKKERKRSQWYNETPITTSLIPSKRFQWDKSNDIKKELIKHEALISLIWFFFKLAKLMKNVDEISQLKEK